MQGVRFGAVKRDDDDAAGAPLPMPDEIFVQSERGPFEHAESWMRPMTVAAGLEPGGTWDPAWVRYVRAERYDEAMKAVQGASNALDEGRYVMRDVTEKLRRERVTYRIALVVLALSNALALVRLVLR